MNNSNGSGESKESMLRMVREPKLTDKSGGSHALTYVNKGQLTKTRCHAASVVHTVSLIRRDPLRPGFIKLRDGKAVLFLGSR